MIEDPVNIDRQAIKDLANASGIAIALVDEHSRQIFAANNNSICIHLNPTDEFSPACAEFCGRAFERAASAGKTISYECHAGLECRAALIDGPKPLVAITGRVFPSIQNYLNAAERSMSGDWNRFSPTKFLGNAPIADSAAALDRTVEVIKTMARTTDVATPDLQSENRSSEAPPSDSVQKASTEKLSEMVERFNREQADAPEITPAPPPRPKERRMAEARAWRSFFGSLLDTEYENAADSILGFLARQFGFKSLIWLENKENRLESTSGFGEMKKRRLRLGIAADDSRLGEALQNYLPLELAERSRLQKAARVMHLFPIGVGGNVSAAIAVLDPIAGENVKRQIARIAHSIAPQLEILRLRGELIRGESLSAAIRRFGENLRNIDAEDLWLNLTQNAAEMLRAERASLLIFDENVGALAIKAIIGAKNESPENEEIGSRVAKHVLAAGEPFAVADISKTGLRRAPDRLYKTDSFLSCPVSISGRPIGVMSFTDRACGLAFDKRSLDLFQAIAPQLAVAIDRATLKEKAGEFEQLSVTDPLTGLLNRRYMEARLLEETKRSTRHGFPMSFMMLDVDHFKSYNDQFGHPAGDEALKLVGDVMRETLRGADVAARFGGEEFAILLPQTTRDEAAAIAERIRGNIEQADFAHRRVTTSIGIASCSAELCLSADLVSAADKALYAAKGRGRNRVIAFEEISGVAVRN